jgi:hypothetical protein
MDDTGEQRATWTFFTNHARVLVTIAADPEARIRDIAARIGITERAAQGIVKDLQEAGYVLSTRDGRRNRYEIVPGGTLRHPSQTDIPVQALIDLFANASLLKSRARRADPPRVV